MKYALSTSWHGISTFSAQTLIARAAEMGFEQIELGFHLSSAFVEGYLAAARAGRIRICSVHNVCPVPQGFTPGRFFPDHFSLASLDDDERARAVALARATLQVAQRCAARAMVLHAGRVDVPERMTRLRALAEAGERESAAYRQLFDTMRRERNAARQPHLQALVRSLDELLPEAERLQIPIALETRYYYRELPDVDEFGEIFARFHEAAYLKYWHDVGHAQVAEYLGIAAHRDFLTRYADRLCGMHLHDVSGCRDHQVPGTGEFDFSLLTPYLRPEVIGVVEVHPPVQDEALARARLFLESMQASTTA